MRVMLRVMLLGVIATTTMTATVAAQPAVTIDKTRVAKEYVDAGLAAQSSGDYDTAIELYSKAYQLVRHPLLVFNMAQANRLAGRIDVALRLNARYLQEDPDGPQVKNVYNIVAEIAAQRAEEARKRADAREAEQARKAEDARKVAEALEPRPAERVQLTAPPLADEPPTPGRTLRIAGITSGAVGVLALGLGAGFGLHARALSSELSQPGALYSQSKYDAGQRANTIAVTGLVGGAVLVAAGAVLYWWGHVEGERPGRVTLAPVSSDHIIGLAAIGALP